MYAINNVATADAYPTPPAGSSLACTGAVKFNVIVLNAAVFMETVIREIDGTTTTGSDELIPPGNYNFIRPVNRLRFKSAATGVPGRVIVSALLGSEA